MTSFSVRNRKLCVRFVWMCLLCVPGGLLACDASKVPLAECTARESETSGNLAKCREQLAIGNSAAETCRASLKALVEEKTALHARLDAVEKENAEFRKTPSAVSQEILAAADAAGSLSEIETVLTSIKEFRDRFPGAAEIKPLARRVSPLKKARNRMRKEAKQAEAMKAISEIKSQLSGVQDGADLSVRQMITVARHLADKDLKYSAISKMPHCNFKEAMKDPDSERGKSIRIRGRIIQITKDGDYFTGLICTGRFCDKIYYFMTPGTTRGLNEQSNASFAGIVAQRYSYPNSGGGTTHSLALVGYFKGQG